MDTQRMSSSALTPTMTSEDGPRIVLTALQPFENFADLQDEEKHQALQNLSVALDVHGFKEPHYSCAIHAHEHIRTLVKLNSLGGCELLLKLIASEQRSEESDLLETLKECLSLLRSVISTRPILKDETSVICNIISLFRHILLAVRDEDIIDNFIDVCLQAFHEDTATSREVRVSVENACRDSVVSLCTHILSTENVGSILRLLTEAGEARFSEKNHSRVIVEVESVGERKISIDLLSGVCLAVIQSRQTLSDRRAAAEELADAIKEACLQCATIGKEKWNRMSAFAKSITTDALAVLRVPEWPIAEIFLSRLLVRMQELLSSSTMRTPLQTLCVTLIGSMAVKVEQDLMERNEWAPPTEHVAVSPGGDASTVDSKTIACPCGDKSYSGRLLVDCTRCRRWYHANCIGVDSLDPALKERALSFRCTDCDVFEQLEKDVSAKSDGMLTPSRVKSKETASSMSPAPFSPSDSPSRIALDPYAKRQKLIRDHLRYRYLLTKDERYLSALRCYADETLDEVTITEETTEVELAKQVRLCLTRKGASRMARILAQDEKSDDRLCNTNRRTQLLYDLAVVMTSSSRPDVRARAAEAIGNLLDTNKSLFSDENLLTAVKSRMNDASIKVREACLQHVISKLDKHSGSPEYLDLIIDSMDDEGASVRKRAIELACQYLGSEINRDTEILNKLALCLEDAAELSVKDVINKSFLAFLKCDPHKVATAVCTEPLTSPEAIRTLLKFPLEESLSEMRSPRTATRSASSGALESSMSSIAALESLVTALMNRLGQAEKDDYVTLRALKGVAKLEPKLVESCLRNLVPILANDSKGGMPNPDQCGEVCEILALSSLDGFDQDLRRQLASNLESIIFRSRKPHIMPQVIQAMVRLSAFDTNLGHLKRVKAQFHSFLAKANGNHDITNTIRAVYCLGLIARYAPLDQADLSDIAQLIEIRCDPRCPLELRERAVQAAGFIIVNLPSTKLFKQCILPALKDSRHPTVQARALAALCAILDASSGRSDLHEATLQSMVVECVVLIRELLLGPDDACRLEAVKVIKALLSHGKIHPEQCFPHLLALERDPALKKLVHGILASEHKKLATSITEVMCFTGIQLSRAYSVPEPAENAGFFVESYEDFVCTAPVKTRFSFLGRLAELVFDPKLELNKIVFFCGVIAALPITKQNEAVWLYKKIMNIAKLKYVEIRGILDNVLGSVIKALATKVPITEDFDIQDPKVLGALGSCPKVALAYELCTYLKKSYRLSAEKLDSTIFTDITDKEFKTWHDMGSVQISLFKPSFDAAEVMSSTSRRSTFMADKVFRLLLQASKNEEKVQVANDGVVLTPNTTSSGRLKSKIPRNILDADNEDVEDVVDEDEPPEETSMTKKKKQRRVPKSASGEDDDEETAKRRAVNTSPSKWETNDSQGNPAARSQRIAKKTKLDFVAMMGVSPSGS